MGLLTMEWSGSVTIICIVGLVNLGAGTSFDCPSQGNLPDPDNCKCFYECGHPDDIGVQVCRADGLYFTADGKCDWDDLCHSGCGDRPYPGTNPCSSTSTQSTITTKNPTITSTTTTSTLAPATAMASTTAEMGWEMGVTKIDIFDGFDLFDCKLSFDFKVEVNLEDVQIKNSSAECTNSTNNRSFIDKLGYHEFELPSETGENFICRVAVGMAKGKYIHGLFETLSCLSGSFPMSCPMPPATTIDFPRVKAELYGATIIRFLQLLQKPFDFNDNEINEETADGLSLAGTQYPPLTWGLVPYVFTRENEYKHRFLSLHQIYGKVPCRSSGVYLFFMAPSDFDFQQPNQINRYPDHMNQYTEDTMNRIMGVTGTGWQGSNRYDDNRSQFIIPFYVGVSGNIKSRYGDHNRNEAVERWRNMMTKRRTAGETIHFDLFFTFVELKTRVDAVLIEQLLLDTFDFIDNEDENDKRRSNGLCSDCRIYNSEITENEKDEMLDVKGPMKKNIEPWLDRLNGIYPFMKNIFGTFHRFP